MITMDTQSQLKVDIIAKVSEAKISIDNASKLLRKSRRTVERYLRRYRDEGVSFFVHKNRKSVPPNKISSDIKTETIRLIKDKYYDFNLTHLREKLADSESIYVKRETLRQWAHEIHHVKRAKRRRSQVRKRRERMESEGLLLQMDGSPHLWFGDKKSCLILIIDDSTSEIHAEFFDSETSLGCMKVIQHLVEKKGVFKTLYVDRAGIFGGPKRCNFSQVQRACKELGIEIIFANSPEGKGRVERSFDTLQDRLVPELRINGISTMEEANQFLKKTFIPEYWNQNLTVAPSNSQSEYTEVDKTIDIGDIFQLKEYRELFSKVVDELHASGLLI